MEVASMFENMVKGWFGGEGESSYNDFIKALLLNDVDCAYIIEFKVHKPRKEKDLEETLANALLQIEEKQYEAELIAEGFAPERIRRYGIVFEGKKCLIG